MNELKLLMWLEDVVHRSANTVDVMRTKKGTYPTCNIS